MKKLFFSWLTIMALMQVQAQSTVNKAVKIYGYSQVTLPGIIPVETDEQGNRIRKMPERKPMYHIYIVSDKPGITINDLYIKREKYSFQTEKVLHTPVLEERPDIPEKGTKKTLVPKSAGTVFKLAPVEAAGQTKAAAALQNLLKKSELVVGYTLAGKKYYATLKKIIVLEPIAAY
jgi:hypothetical protein